MKSYANFGISRSFLQVDYALQSRTESDRNMALLYQSVREQEGWMEAKLGRPLKGLRILEVGPGQGMERAHYFGIHNTVTGMDLDVIPIGFDPAAYWKMVRNNGFGRLLKTIGRKLILGNANQRAWKKAVGQELFRNPTFLIGNICESCPGESAYDVAMSWSVFEHLPNPVSALENIIRTLRPGGLLFISIHLFTANNGHHDIRAFTGREGDLPPWGHLRSGTQHKIEPSSYLNEWRLAQWRDLFSNLAPGHDEYLGSHNRKYAGLLTPDLRQELSEFDEEELVTVDAIYVWKKPGTLLSTNLEGKP